MQFKYAEVIIAISNLNIDHVFHYAIPKELSKDIKEGSRVCVPFGKSNKKTEGYIISFSNETSYDESKIKYIDSILDNYPIFTKELITVAKLMHKKYFSTLNSCLQCIMPTGIKIKKESDFYKTKYKNAKTPKMEISNDSMPIFSLTVEQTNALSHINSIINSSNNEILIHGITGSGKTEIYMHLVENMLSQGKQAIVLVPEISLTHQIVSRFMQRFGSEVLITHSKMSNGERFNQWIKARNSEAGIMIGPRSAIFTPFNNLGIIIIDEEHENTYKSEFQPKYHAHEIARMRCKLTGASLILGSATPSIETYFNVKKGNSELITLRKRANKSELPKIKIIDMRDELLNGNRSIFSLDLKSAIEYNLTNSEQTILFLNRRGHSTFVSCRKCGHVLKCDNCSVSYTYHFHDNYLLCHYCGKKEVTPKFCPVCSSSYIKYFGVGTQKIEEAVNKEFPNAVTIRMDLDTTSKKNSHNRILKQFASGKADILIGTQMIAKGHDFPNVTLVGIVAADMSLNIGDYRACEITFQLITQVAGRAGRGTKKGRVFVQTYSPEHYSIKLALSQNYEAFYEEEIRLRQQLNYPPFTSLFVVLLSGKNEKNVIIVCFKLLEIMKKYNYKNDFEILGPAPAIVSKINNNYRWKLIIKCVDDERLKNFVIYCIDKLKSLEKLDEFNLNLTLNPVYMV